MKRTSLVALLLASFAVAATADERVKQAESALKDQGFYYGEINGRTSSELTAAIRRYQIRNGLEVTGELNAETSGALGLSGGPRSASAPSAAPGTAPEPPRSKAPDLPPEPPAAPAPPVNLRRNESPEDSDRRILRQEMTRPRDPAVVRPPAPLDESPVVRPGSAYSALFTGTPYASAPASVQRDAILRAQRALAGRGFYRDGDDDPTGAALEEALLSYQHSRGMRLTGRLDLETLNALRLLPGMGEGNPPFQRYTPPNAPVKQHVYRGIWVE